MSHGTIHFRVEDCNAHACVPDAETWVLPALLTLANRYCVKLRGKLRKNSQRVGLQGAGLLIGQSLGES